MSHCFLLRPSSPNSYFGDQPSRVERHSFMTPRDSQLPTRVARVPRRRPRRCRRLGRWAGDRAGPSPAAAVQIGGEEKESPWRSVRGKQLEPCGSTLGTVNRWSCLSNLVENRSEGLRLGTPTLTCPGISLSAPSDPKEPKQRSNEAPEAPRDLLRCPSQHRRPGRWCSSTCWVPQQGFTRGGGAAVGI